MKRGFVLWNGLLEKLAENDKLETIILGTGTMARDMQIKLRLFNIKTAPFLVGGVDDPENGIRHYESLVNLNNPQGYRFICCYDVDECKLIMPTYSVVYKLLGMASANHPRLIRFSADTIWSEYAGKYHIDSHIHECFIRGKHLYSVSGSEGDESAFRIHMFGRCTVSGNYQLNEYALPELLQSKLYKAGLNSVVYSWGHPNNTISNSIIQLLRDAQFFKPDMVILFSTMEDFNPVFVTEKNPLSVRTGIRSQMSVGMIKSLCSDKINNGINCEIDMPTLALVQNKIFMSLSKSLDFSFWNVLSPNADVLLPEQSKQLLNLSEGHFLRAQKRKKEIIDLLNSPNVKDYTNTFNSVTDIFNAYSDTLHFTNNGNEMVAERLSLDILTEFGDRNRKYLD